MPQVPQGLRTGVLLTPLLPQLRRRFQNCAPTPPLTTARHPLSCPDVPPLSLLLKSVSLSARMRPVTGTPPTNTPHHCCPLGARSAGVACTDTNRFSEHRALSVTHCSNKNTVASYCVVGQTLVKLVLCIAATARCMRCFTRLSTLA
jgi:hypothetical protein